MATTNNSSAQARAVAALKLMFVADALAMPVHWFYNPQDILKAFPAGIRHFEAAPAYHPHDFLSLPPATEQQIVGDIILKDKKCFWGIPHQHVHQGMLAGDNTLNACCARLVMRTLAQNAGRYDANLFLNNYIAFMTSAVPQHPDTYAEYYHRAFFKNLASGLSPNQCGQAADTTASMGGLVTIAPIAITALLAERNLPLVQKMCREHVWLTHPDNKLAAICDAYIELIDTLLFRAENESARDIIAAIAQKSVHLDLPGLCSKHSDDNDVIGNLFSKACPIDDSWPSLLYLAYKYNTQPTSALLANTNVGGENCHRGAVLGVVMGLLNTDGLDELFTHLIHRKEITQEIRALGLAA